MLIKLAVAGRRTFHLGLTPRVGYVTRTLCGRPVAMMYERRGEVVGETRCGTCGAALAALTAPPRTTYKPPDRRKRLVLDWYIGRSKKVQPLDPP